MSTRASVGPTNPPAVQVERTLMRAERIRAGWRRIDPVVANAVHEVISREAERIAERFFSVLLELDEARPFLSHELVQARLRCSLVGWLRSLAAPDRESELPLIERQYEVGQVHARIKVPLRLLGTGVRLIRRDLGEALLREGWDKQTTADAILWVTDRFDLFVECMEDSSVGSLTSQARDHQTLQSALVSGQLALDCERLRSELFDWERRAVVALFEGRGESAREPADGSFALWLTHKAPLALGEAPELAELGGALDALDRQVQHTCARWDEVAERGSLIGALHQQVGAVSSLLTTLSEKVTDAHAGGDALTRLLSRRHLPAVLQQEVAVARRTGKLFALLLVDVDHFKAINDRHGQRAGDAVLAGLTELLQRSAGPGDFAFRYGGEQFLLVLTEVGGQAAGGRAESLREAVAATTLTLEGGEPIRITVSVGVAAFADHPDYDRLLRAAEEALLRAKAAGRNRVEVA